MTCDLTPYIDALHDIASEAGLVLLGGADNSTLRSAAVRYNDIRHHLIARLPAVATIYRLLPVGSSPGTLRLAARDVAEFVRALPGNCCLHR